MSDMATSPHSNSISSRDQSYVDRGVDLLRDRGYKVTSQRRAILELFERRGEHLQPAQIHARLESKLPSLSLATVYNTLELFEQEGLVNRVTARDGETYFDPNVDPHHHAVCNECGELFDIEITDEALGQLVEASGTTDCEDVDFSIAGATIWFRGTCESCECSN